ncbi:MAG: hypothetical protein ABJF10_03695 [Chthoniobacter sp.]|uniref:hypothetical protein n=1 Tax=Chthoniobacter sp. TaxID=2510640 RepID=UPI0032A745B7
MATFGSQGRNEPPTLRVRTPAGTAEILRSHLGRHNRRVLAFAAATLVAALAAWALLYFVSCWIMVLGFAVYGSPRTRLPHGYWLLYAVTALCAIGYAWIDQRLTPNARPRDNKGLVEVVLEFLLAVPNMTLAVGGTLAAWQSLSDEDLLEAADLLHRLGEEKRVPISSVRLQIPDPEAAVRILFALQMTEVIDAHRDGNEFWLRLNALRPAGLRMAPEGPAAS